MLNIFTKLCRKKLKRNINKDEVLQESLSKMQEKGAILLDVRSPQEYAEGHLEGAILMPEYEIGCKTEEILKDKQALIITYCSTGQRSKKAQKKLKKLGYTTVYNLYNGFQNY